MSEPSEPRPSEPQPSEPRLGDAARAAGRLPLLAPAELDERQRAVWEGIATGPRASGPFRVADEEGHLLGPFNALLHSPAVGEAVQQVGGALRFGGTLASRVRELVICAVAAHWGSEYEWYAHSRVAAQVGVTRAELEAVRSQRIPDGLDPAESSALRLAGSLLRDRAVDDETYAEALEHHGQAGVVELAVLVGYYQLLAGLLAAVDVGAPTDATGRTT